MLKAVFFDAGGTLVHLDYERVRAALLRSVGRAPGVAELAASEYEGRAAVELALDADPALADGSRWRLHFGAALASLGFGPEDLVKAAPEIRAEHARGHLWTAVPDGVPAALAALRAAGFVVGCVSNSDGTVAQLLAHVGLLPLLDPVIDSALVGFEKPDPEIFRVALERAGVAAAEAVHVGDLFGADVVGARRAGLEPVLLDPLDRYGGLGCRTAHDIPTLCRELVSSRSHG